MTGKDGTERDGIILAGGRAQRLGGAAKPLLTVAGRTMLQRAVTALRHGGCGRVIVTGPDDLGADPGVIRTREDPPFGGPVAGIVAALGHVTAPRVILSAADLPWIERAVPFLLESAQLSPVGDGICLADASGRPQWLTGLYRTASLRDAADHLPGGGRDASMRALLADLEIHTVRAPGELTADVDTWQDLERARARPAEPNEAEET